MLDKISNGIIGAGKPKRGGLPSFSEGSHSPDVRKEGAYVVTYSDLIQFSILIVALVGLCYQIFKDKRK
ncbi:hypothetical protein E1963_16550 [Extibacter muris]|uniref:Holin-like toxin n=1 Tax=Extibacter muris TaxID=1796622 RepID=A0A4R4FAL7_9FIRM|nr:hypothetical protein E1963_16550 [Extibacter muris]